MVNVAHPLINAAVVCVSFVPALLLRCAAMCCRRKVGSVGLPGPEALRRPHLTSAVTRLQGPAVGTACTMWLGPRHTEVMRFARMADADADADAGADAGAVAADDVDVDEDVDVDVDVDGGGEQADDNLPLVVCVIPGNPGAVAFYEAFAGELHAQLGGRAEVVVHGHAAHSVDSAAPHASHRFLLADQVAHHTHFVRHLLTSSALPWAAPVAADEDDRVAAREQRCRVVLVGHSIGAYICMEVMRTLEVTAPGPAPLSSVCLFPTFSHMAVTPNGLRLSPVLRHLKPAAHAAMRVVEALPSCAKRAIGRAMVGSAVWNANGAGHVQRGVLALMSPTVAVNALTMGDCEMQQVRTPDVAWMAAHQSRLAFLYAAQDDWVHGDEPARMQAAFPRARVQQSEAGVHAFVLQHSHMVAQETAQLIAAMQAGTK